MNQLTCKLQSSSNLKKVSVNSLINRGGALPRIKVKGAVPFNERAKVRASAIANALHREISNRELILLDKHSANLSGTSNATGKWLKHTMKPLYPLFAVDSRMCLRFR